MKRLFDRVSTEAVWQFRKTGSPTMKCWDNMVGTEIGVQCRGCGNATFLATNLYIATCPACGERGYHVQAGSWDGDYPDSETLIFIETLKERVKKALRIDEDEALRKPDWEAAYE